MSLTFGDLMSNLTSADPGSNFTDVVNNINLLTVIGGTLDIELKAKSEVNIQTNPTSATITRDKDVSVSVSRTHSISVERIVNG